MTQSFDFTTMMKMFDPDQIAKMFDPEQFKAVLATPDMPNVDFNAALESNRQNFEAMRAANTAATEAYRDFYQKQMKIFEEAMQAANDQVASISEAPGPEATQKQAEIYRAAMEKALKNMTELAKVAKTANEEAFATIQERFKASLAELKTI